MFIVAENEIFTVLNAKMVPLSTVLGGGLTAVEAIQQAFSPAISVLVSPEVDLICGKNRLTFVELLQPFSRLSVEGNWYRLLACYFQRTQLHPNFRSNQRCQQFTPHSHSVPPQCPRQFLETSFHCLIQALVIRSSIKLHSPWQQNSH